VCRTDDDARIARALEYEERIKLDEERMQREEREEDDLVHS